MEGKKNDQDKIQPTLIDFTFIEGISEVLKHGAKQYAPNNWKNLSQKRIMDAFLRHAIALGKGELYDKESGLSHILHAATNLMFLDHLTRYENELDIDSGANQNDNQLCK